MDIARLNAKIFFEKVKTTRTSDAVTTLNVNTLNSTSVPTISTQISAINNKKNISVKLKQKKFFNPFSVPVQKETIQFHTNYFHLLQYSKINKNFVC